MSDVHWLACATGNPPQFFSQDEAFRLAGYSEFPYEERRRVQALFRAASVEKRALWIPEGDYRLSDDPDDFHQRYATGLRALVPGVARRALSAAGLEARDIDFVVFASCTGYTCPGYSVELAYELGVPEDKPTANCLGMGCSALVPALGRAWDHLKAHPGSRALVVTAEICSATYWIDHDAETMVGNSIFGDGATAVILSSDPADLRKPRARPPQDAFTQRARIESFHTLRDGRYLNDMGFTVEKGRLRVRLAREIPERILPLVLGMVKKIEIESGTRVAIHPGGRKILDALEQGLKSRGCDLGDSIRWSREVLRNYGNMSSPTAAFVLRQSFEDREVPKGGEPGAMITMGPGLSVEAMKLTWLG
jgi:polyketide synthase Type III